MTHFAVIVLSEHGTEDEITKLLAPFDENDEWGRPGSRWDWWEVGGRFTGLLDNYDPEKDPRNIETCDLCGGTGNRAKWRNEPTINQHPSGCNGCIPGPDGKATGRKLKWPTQWAPHNGDRVPVTAIDTTKMPWLPALLTPDGEWHEPVEGGYGMFGAERGPRKDERLWAAEFTELLSGHSDKIAVVVDCHV